MGLIEWIISLPWSIFNLFDWFFRQSNESKKFMVMVISAFALCALFFGWLFFL